MLGLTIEKEHHTVELVADDEGLAVLERIAHDLRERRDTHVHLMSQEWGAGEYDLDVLPVPSGSVAVHMLTVRHT